MTFNKAVSGISAADKIQFRAQYATSPTDIFVESPPQYYFGETRLPPPYNITLQSRQLEVDPITHELTVQWQASEFSGTYANPTYLDWDYYIRLNDQVPFAVTADGGKALEEVFLWKKFGLLRTNVRVSVECLRVNNDCTDVLYAGVEYDIPKQTTWISTWSEPALLNLDSPQRVAGEAPDPNEPDAGVVGLILLVMGGAGYPISETLATTFSVLLCLGLAVGGAVFIVRRMGATLVGVSLSAAFALFIFVGLGLELFGVDPALVVVIIAAPLTLAALTLIRRLSL